MTTHSDDSNAKALKLFERALDQPKHNRVQWIKDQTPNDAQLRKKALSYLSRDEDASKAIQTGGALYETLDDTAIPEQIGAYKIISLIGRGGMGSVYRGQRASGDFDHDVAIKVVRPGAMSDKLVARFENERQTLANLSHPNIARLYDGGTLDNGAPYIVMEFIDGVPVTEWAKQQNLSKPKRLQLFKSVCMAVEHAHQNLIIHRDITPSNVLVDKSGQVKLIDFGIAKPFDEDAALNDMENSLA
ncbi:MAG TPA: serine/threonine protein kinase, partial [Hellea balneolensis]|nr:serine/threonine protein kinase [Hellea balneolensis]